MKAHDFIPKFPTLAGFARKIGVDADTITNWTKRHSEFFGAVSRAKTIGEDILVTNGLLGLYNPAVFQFVAKNYTNMRDLKEVQVSAGVDLWTKSAEELDLEIEKSRKDIERLKSML